VAEDAAKAKATAVLIYIGLGMVAIT